MVLRDTIDNIVQGFDASYIKDKDNVPAVIKVELTINGKVEKETLMIDWEKLPKQ